MFFKESRLGVQSLNATCLHSATYRLGVDSSETLSLPADTNKCSWLKDVYKEGVGLGQGYRTCGTRVESDTRDEFTCHISVFDVPPYFLMKTKVIACEHHQGNIYPSPAWYRFNWSPLRFSFLVYLDTVLKQYWLWPKMLPKISARNGNLEVTV
jgi:hypothetical protein